jgi:maleylacetoacetate isomerase
MALPRLHTYFRSSAAYRVRIALNLKGIAYEPVAWNLAKGEHLDGRYREIAGFGLMPVLEIDGLRLQQSMAIIEYLDERNDGAALLLPKALAQRARARALAQLIACEIHPLNNLRVLKLLRGSPGFDEAAVSRWYRHWCDEGLSAVEAELARTVDGPYAIGELPSIVECCLIPQVYNARRFEVDMSRYPRIEALDKLCARLPAFDAARPSKQPDAPAPVAAP